MAGIQVAVMNTSKEITAVLEEILRSEGFATCSTYTFMLKEHKERFDEFVKKNHPSVIVYDIAIPYEENYNLYKQISDRPSADGISFVLTTTNKKALEKLVGKTKAHEIIGKPYDLQEIVDAVNAAYKSNGK
jgi:DNA-binding response OmpR family regulator